MNLNDLLSGLIKAAVFGLLLATIGCQQGFYTTGGAEVTTIPHPATHARCGVGDSLFSPRFRVGSHVPRLCQP